MSENINHEKQLTNYRKSLAVALLALIFAVDLYAVYQLFGTIVQTGLFGAILGIQTLLILAYHQRCLQCEGCMDKAGGGIYLFYKVFAVIGFFSVLLLLLKDIIPIENQQLKIGVAITYAALLITGISTAFNAIIGVRNVADCSGSKTSANDIPLQQEKAVIEDKENQAFEVLQQEKQEQAEQESQEKAVREAKLKRAIQRKKDLEARNSERDLDLNKILHADRKFKHT